ncbi:hypothetical protein ACFO0N_02440 [Halobium salinum]|uniref:Uncharacterized protein n=1 Tax=Halobium salinum TaxID=1364940 RepID=A0ABD5P7T6_9EURY|nr:hypothetical protein [Halobium salinum]
MTVGPVAVVGAEGETTARSRVDGGHMALQGLRRLLEPRSADTDERSSASKSPASAGEPVGRRGPAEATPDESLDDVARRMAEGVCAGFKYHDQRRHEEAVEAFYVVDINQFPGVEDEVAYNAAEAYVDALWEKDAVEERHLVDGEIDPGSMADADYTSVYDPLARRANLLGVDELYASRTAEAWHLHKTGDDYWTPFLEAQDLELQVAMGEAYPDKPRGGQGGYGPLATRYLVGVELHDMHEPECWERAVDVMAPYYRQILDAHERR